MSYWTIRRSVKKTLARHINEIQTQSSQENYAYITTHSPEYAEPSNIGESSNNLNSVDQKPRAEKKKKNRTTNLDMEISRTKNSLSQYISSCYEKKMHKCALFSF